MMPIMLCTINKDQASFLVLYVLDSYLYILTASLRDVFIETKIQKCNLTILLTFIAPVSLLYDTSSVLEQVNTDSSGLLGYCL